MKNSLILLASSERSGSNLITRMMSAHPDIHGPSATHLTSKLLPYLHLFKPPLNKEQYERLADILICLIEDRNLTWLSETADLRRAIFSKETQRSVWGALGAIYDAECDASGKAHIFVKDNGIIDHILELRAGFPDCRIIHLVRDPRDMAASWKKSLGHTGGVGAAAKTWSEQQRAAERAKNACDDNLALLTVPYELLTNEAKKASLAFCNFLKIPFSEKMLSFNESSASKLHAKTYRAWENLEKPIIKGNSGKFRTELSRREIDIVERTSWVEMSCYKYPIENPSNMRTSFRYSIKFGQLFRGIKLLLRTLISEKGELQSQMNRLKKLASVNRRLQNEAYEAHKIPADFRSGENR